jgi:FkbM family methyltransferase
MSCEAFLGSLGLGRVLADLRVTCLDVGARHGFTQDLLPLAPAVDAYGFEPDPEECERLNLIVSKGTHPWRSLRFIPVALGRERGTRTLNLYRQRGCSSLLKADVALAETFSRDDYYQLDDTVDLQTMPLDSAAVEYGFTDAVFMKIDIQGSELEVFASGPQLLREALLAIRTEISFIPLYQDQPLYCDVDSYLRGCGFVPMRFVELHHWRRTTKRKHPHLTRGPMPYSRGQIVHGDMLYFRDPDTMADDTPEAIQALLKAAFLALAYEYIDHALAIVTRPAVAEHLQSTYGLEPVSALGDVSRFQARQYRRAQWLGRWQNVKRWLRMHLGSADV